MQMRRELLECRYCYGNFWCQNWINGKLTAIANKLASEEAEDWLEAISREDHG